MDVSTLTRSVREYLATSLGKDAEVCPAEDEFSALSVLLGSAPGHCRVVVYADDLEAIGGGDPLSVGCHCSLRIIVQVRRGMSITAAAKAEEELLTAEKAVRNWLLAARYHRPPAEQLELTGEAPSTPPAPHDELGTWRFTRSGTYESPVQDVALEHPARELRMTIPIALTVPAWPERVFI